uniref:Uncharacterized protein n=1 Tax=Anguilla anguilla TaxID=7936 RepID=A0A0E9W6J3_ANGAN
MSFFFLIDIYRQYILSYMYHLEN